MSSRPNPIEFQTVTSLMGISQRQDVDQIGDNLSPLSVNISNDKPGTWCKRNGIPIIGTSRPGGIQGLIEWTANTSLVTNVQRRIHYFRGQNVAGSYNLETLDLTNNSFNPIDTSQTTISPIQSVNFNDKIYHIGKNNFLSYETGSALVVNSQMIQASCMAFNQGRLFLGNVTTLNNTPVDYQSRVYYSDFTNNQLSDNFFDSAKGQTIVNTTNYFNILAPVIGIFAFSATGLTYIFTRDSCYSFDVRYLDNSTGPLKKFSIGLINTRAICEFNGMMIWMDYEGRIWGWSGYGMPSNMSWELQDDENGEAILSQLNKSNLNNFCCGTYYNKIYFSLGDSINYKGTVVTNPVLRGLASQNFQSITWGLDSFPVKPSIFTTAIINNQRKLIFGSSSTDDIYQINNGLLDGSTTAINAFARTKFLDFGMPLYDKQFRNIYIKYRPQPNPGTYLTVKFAVDGSFTYTTISDPVYVGAGQPATGVVKAGTIDMNVGFGSTPSFFTQVIRLPQSANGRNISIEIGNNKASQQFEISAIGVEFVNDGYLISSKSS